MNLKNKKENTDNITFSKSARFFIGDREISLIPTSQLFQINRKMGNLLIEISELKEKFNQLKIQEGLENE